MINIPTIMSLVAAATGIGAQAPKPTPAPLPNGTVIVKVIPSANAYDGNYTVDGEETKKTPDERYAEMKAKLDERFSYMFELKKEMDEHNMQANAKWEEYHALHQAYERQLKKLIADWVTEQSYQ